MKRRGIEYIFSVIVFVFIISGCFNNEQIKKTDKIHHFTFSELQKEELNGLFDAYKDNRRFNGVFLVGQKDSIFFSRAEGVSNYINNDSLSIHSSFQLASVSKQFTAVAILKLYQENKLKLTDSIQVFFPDFPYHGINVHQLLVHRSGLPNYHYFIDNISTSYDTLLSNSDLVNELITKQPAVYYKPNQRYSYSNTGYALLASIVEKVSGMSFSDYLSKQIFKPLEMNNTFTYRADKSVSYPKRVTGYLRYWRQAEDNFLDGVLGDKGIYSSAYDLFLWDQSLYKGDIIDIDIMAQAFEPMGLPLNAQINYGYGWRMLYWSRDSLKVNYHYGWWHGFRSLVMHIPSDKVTVVVLKNCSKGQMIKVRSVLSILYPFQDTTVYTNQDSVLNISNPDL